MAVRGGLVEHFKEYTEILSLAKEIGDTEIVSIVNSKIFDEQLERELHKYTQASKIVEEVNARSLVKKHD